MKEIPTEEYSPEKAGVGGSIPSLATRKSITLQETNAQLPIDLVLMPVSCPRDRVSREP
jgi:hypothetical protein